jgi:hypothetical protein
MVRKTRRQTKHKSSKSEGIFTIPELRRSFEYIEHRVHTMIQEHKPKEEMIRDIRKDWFRVFRKQLSKRSATEFIEHCMTHSSKKKGTRKHRGGSMALQGAPLLHDLRQGEYHFSSQGGMGDYWLKGLGVGIPEIAAPGKADWPHPVPDMALPTSVTSMKGGNRKLRRTGGAAPLTTAFEQMMARPFSASEPSSMLQDAQRMWAGQQPGLSPDQTQQHLTYSTMPGQIKPISI